MSNTNEAKMDMSALGEMPRPSLSKEFLPTSSSADVIVDLAFECRELLRDLAKLERDIEANPESVSEHHKELWRKQAEAMRAYKEVLGERIKDLIDNE